MKLLKEKMMKYAVKMFDGTYVLSQSDLETLIEVLNRSDQRAEESVGEGLGNIGWKNSYIHVIRSVPPTTPSVEAMTDTQYEALVSLTKMRDATK
jgi:hypothetical protein